ncbi:MAG: DNA-directed DNA polymerase [Methanocellales archaeon]|nr:DNA-directed DNA polymerase [Methanocellales archaeon]
MDQISGWLLDVDYITQEAKAVIRLWCRDDQGRDVVIFDPNFEPYFYAVGATNHRFRSENKGADDIMAVRVTRYGEAISPKRVETVKRRDFGKEVEAFKIIVEHPQHVPSLREAVGALGMDVREADVLFAVRYIIDHGLAPMDGIIVQGKPIDIEYAGYALEASEVKPQRREGNPDLRIMAFDCEMINPRGMPSPKRDPIIIIGVATNRGDVKSLTSKDEPSLIREFVDFIHDINPDVICGYNSDNFDWPYLLHRAELAKIPLKIGKDGSTPQLQPGIRRKISIAGRLNVDLYRVVDRDLGSVKVKTLENVADFLGVMKKSERVNLPASKIYQYWEDPEKRKTLLEYARDDVNSTLAIAEKMLPLQYEFARMSRQPLDEVSKMGRGRQVESFLSAEAYKIGELVPSKGGVSAPYAGGFVLKPKKGIHENVACLDFSAMYPSIMISFNISPDTVISDGDEFFEAPEVGYKFRKKPDGFFKRILQDMITRRNNLKCELAKHDRGTYEYQLLDIRQNAIKILTNAFYGYTGWSAARWYRKECAEATTAWGRHFIKGSIQKAEEMGLEVLYGDTDSLFIKADTELRGRAKEFSDAISKELPLELDVENYYEVIFFTEKKKRYAGLTADGEIVIKGLEVRRGDWCALAKETQAQVVEVILRERDPAKAVRLVQGIVQQVKEGKVPLEKLVIYKTLTKKISSYESVQAHVRAAKRAKIPIEVGTKIAYVIVRGSGSIGDRAYPVDVFSKYENGYLHGDGKTYKIDAEYYINNQLIPATSRILNYFEQKQATLTNLLEVS